MTAQLLLFVPMTEYPNRIYELRRAKGWSQLDLAEIVGCSKMHISGMERGKRELSLEWMRRLAQAFNVPPVDILADVDNPHRLTDEEQRFLETYRAADPQTKESIQRVTEALMPYKHIPSKAA
ncbi:helix-turn-helix domain-containing protein [Sphingorhabdus sp.]|jgi:transcriptional regulator with XRE-family HTH domain|uniref:helix-turn-helix domain-containing protein n=1 Tax=Sphingorhabdus sp. TaxID=1902408 RepID=UPI0037CCA822